MDEGAELLAGARVRIPPPMVETMVTPWAFVVVMTWPVVNVPAAAAEVVEDVPAALEGELAPGTSGEVLVEVTAAGAFADEAAALAEVDVVSVLGI